MKKILFLMVFLMTFPVYGYVGKIVGESIENYVSACGYYDPPGPKSPDLNYTHDQVQRMIAEWVDKGGTQQAWYTDENAWATDLMDPDLCSGCGTDNYTDDVARLVVFSGHGGVSGNSSTDLWSSTGMCPHNGKTSAKGNKIDFEHASFLVLFTCFSVHDFSKDNTSISENLRNGTTWREWDYTLRKNNSTYDVSYLNMVFGFAGLSTDSGDTDENGEDFIEDMNSESQKQAWFTGNDDFGYFGTDADDRTGVITWGVDNGRYGTNSADDARGRRDNHKLSEGVRFHASGALAWSHHDG